MHSCLGAKEMARVLPSLLRGCWEAAPLTALVPQPPGRFASALSPPPPPRTPRLGVHRRAVTVTLLLSALLIICFLAPTKYVLLCKVSLLYQ